MGLLWQSNRYLSEFSTFGIGGKARYFAEITSPLEMEEAFSFAREQGLEVLILGKGSNCLFSDEGFDGLVLLNRIDFCYWNGNVAEVGAGYSFSLLGIQSARKGLSGLEFASGIPASVGGAVFMNAGANGKETAGALYSVLYLDLRGSLHQFCREELLFSYRYSPFQQMQGAILSASFVFEPSSSARFKQLEIIDRRIKTQPLKELSIGCIFRNPGPEISAGMLIDRCGLKGCSIGDAAISEIHANFIINLGRARAKQVQDLIEKIQQTVYDKTGVRLEPEIRMIGKHGSI
ncbi:MAG: UDP-N-acetylmuramate dehydrogenase [Chlamydiia bacterium]|nr:UDP-N-acetylmuramate dehydrogenase [Chlamydiia bacterium]